MIYQLHNLAFSYAPATKLVLDNISLTIEEGDVISLLGRNGSGKSTLLSCMLGLLKPQAGQILMLGSDISTLSERQIAAIASYVPQSHQPSFSYTVLDFVLMGCASQVGLFAKPGKRQLRQAEDALVELGITQLAERPYTELSGGERQQAAIARAIAAKPRVILFDEPTAHLDFANQLRVLRIIKGLAEKGYAVVITTHNPDHALLLGGKVALLDGAGHLIVGRTTEVVTQEALSAMFAEDVRLEYIESLNRMACLYPNI